MCPEDFLAGDLGCASGADSPMSVGSLAGVGQGDPLTKALRARAPTPAQFKDEDKELQEEEEDMDATTESAQDAQQ